MGGPCWLRGTKAQGWRSDRKGGRIFGAHAPQLAAGLLRSSLTHVPWARSGPRRPTTSWGTWTTNPSPASSAGPLVRPGAWLRARRRPGSPPRSPPHPYALRALEQLALAGDLRGDHHLDALELPDFRRAAHAERGAQRAGEVLRPVVDPGGTDQDLLDAGPDAHLDPRAPGQVGVRGCHAPVEPPRRRLRGAGQRRADHDGVGPGGERLADVGADPHPAVGDDGHVPARAPEVLVAGGGDVAGGGYLGHAHPEHAAGGAGRAGAHADEHAGDAGLHELEGGVVLHAVADHNGDGDRAAQLLEGELAVAAGAVPGGEDRALDHVDVGARLLDGAGPLARPRRGGGDSARDAGGLDLAD